jgi:protein-tyrosine phosphatase
MLDRVLMICSGNVCRSPMAEGLLRARFRRRGAGAVASAGLHALEGRAADPHAVSVLAERGIDITSHRARQVTPELLASFDLVLVMEEAQRHELEALSRAARGRVHLVGRFGGFEVADPHRQPREAFVEACARIDRGLEQFERSFWSGVARARSSAA